MKISDQLRAAEIDWAERAAQHEREIQNIKREIRRLSGTQHVYDRYEGSSASIRKLSYLRQELEKHRLAHGAASAKQLPTKADLDEALTKLKRSKNVYQSHV